MMKRNSANPAAGMDVDKLRLKLLEALRKLGVSPRAGASVAELGRLLRKVQGTGENAR
ncbi:MAG: hypothetical protein IPM18_12060 [Phycisphaerales bacterium]|nr:hypothetical protein [Phycisphaerales bacterium]